MSRMGNQTRHSTGVQERTKPRVKKPDMYCVVLHNDDYTPMEFVVEVLTQIFHLSSREATKIMMQVHKDGSGRVGSYSYDIAYTKSTRTMELARKLQFPLKTTVEKL